MREATVTVSDDAFDAMGIGELLSLSRDAGIREFEELACRGTGAVVQVTVERRYDEERLSALECVDRWNRVSETADGHVYVIAFTAPELPTTLAERADDLLGTCDPELEGETASISLVGSQETISSTLGEFETAGVSADLRKLGAYEGRTRPLDELTDRQREVLRTAHRLGYYEVPRDATTDDVASELELDPSTVAEHLQRAERNVFDRLL
ncbi:bacterio-opsin activator [Natronococcus pandeyae]|uniref:Bacterio-opsin activator n=1 Tax=Natronococcus pandeyae TaxID=2055836 RepID=A0A8J8TRS4_9EURY|nr:bacterio-opsin activator [Natronococcus pandeyae]